MENSTNPSSPNTKPNIIFITVDQMRFPMHFPLGTPCRPVRSELHAQSPHVSLGGWR